MTARIMAEMPVERAREKSCDTCLYWTGQQVGSSGYLRRCQFPVLRGLRVTYASDGEDCKDWWPEHPPRPKPTAGVA